MHLNSVFLTFIAPEPAQKPNKPSTQLAQRRRRICTITSPINTRKRKREAIDESSSVYIHYEFQWKIVRRLEVDVFVQIQPMISFWLRAISGQVCRVKFLGRWQNAASKADQACQQDAIKFWLERRGAKDPWWRGRVCSTSTNSAFAGAPECVLPRAARLGLRLNLEVQSILIIQPSLPKKSLQKASHSYMLCRTLTTKSNRSILIDASIVRVS